jgi:hypothetical protein
MAKRPSENLRIVLLGEEHDRGSFTCGVESLDRYLKTQAGQDVRRKANAVCQIASNSDPLFASNRDPSSRWLGLIPIMHRRDPRP